MQFESLRSTTDHSARRVAEQAEESGLLHFRLCQFSKALPQFLAAQNFYKVEGDWTAYCRTLPLILRICVEMEQDEPLKEIWKEFEALRMQPEFPHTSQVHYAIAIYYNYSKDPVRTHEHFKSALNLAISNRSADGEIYARVGLAGYYYTAGNTEIALAELEKSKQLCHLSSDLNNDLYLSTLIFESVIWRREGHHQRSLESLSEAQSRAKVEVNLYMVINILYNYCLTYLELGDLKKARSQAEFAESLANPDLVRFNRALERATAQVSSNDQMAHDIVLEEGNSPRIRLRDRQSIALKNQHLLCELLKLLGSEPRKAWNKEEIVVALWGENYHPLKHDNKLYVTIRRLRCLIEINEKRPQIVIKNQKGYLLNPALSFAVGSTT